MAGQEEAGEFSLLKYKIFYLKSNFMNDLTSTRWLPIVLLTCSNVFMTFAWYGHLKYKGSPLWLVIIVSWSIAFFEYCFQVPANRWGSTSYSPFQLKVIQEII